MFVCFFISLFPHFFVFICLKFYMYIGSLILFFSSFFVSLHLEEKAFLVHFALVKNLQCSSFDLCFSFLFFDKDFACLFVCFIIHFVLFNHVFNCVFENVTF